MKAKKKAVKKSAGRCMCDEPRTRGKIETTSHWRRAKCQRCKLPLTMPAEKGQHRHCWHPRGPAFGSDAFNAVANKFGTGRDHCWCCFCGEQKAIGWKAVPVPDHGPYWAVVVKVYES